MSCVLERCWLIKSRDFKICHVYNTIVNRRMMSKAKSYLICVSFQFKILIVMHTYLEKLSVFS